MQLSVQTANNVLVISGAIFFVAVMVWTWFHSPFIVYSMRSMLKPHPDYVFDKQRLPAFGKAILVVAFVSAAYATLITRHWDLVGEFIALNTGFAAVAGVNGILYHYVDEPRS